MILSHAVVNGFQSTIQNKVFNFLGHIQITRFDSQHSYESVPIDRRVSFYPLADSVTSIEHMQVFAQMAAIMKTEKQIEGVLLKGVGPDFDWTFLHNRLVKGDTFHITDSVTSNEILISKKIADRLRLDTGQQVGAYIIQDPPRARQFTIKGIYNTGLEEYDKLYCIVDLKHIQKLNNWEPHQVGGFEVFLPHLGKTQEASQFLNKHLPTELQAQSLKQINPNLFDWLKMQDLNKYVILILMILVAAINMITVLLILILERTNMVGILKALGADNWAIQRIFLYNAVYIIGIGLLLGNTVGIGIGVLQKYTGLITIPQKSYYISQVPIQLDWMAFLGINVGTIVVCTLMLIIPSYLVTRITPIKSIRFE